MSWFETDEPGDEAEGDGWGREPGVRRWPLHWEGLYPRERWLWFEQLWSDACALQKRYHLSRRSCWWADQVQVETLAALAAWVEHYASGEWDDPPGKLSLLYDLERVAQVLRDGTKPFHPDRDRVAFARYLINLGGQPPPDDPKVLVPHARQGDCRVGAGPRRGRAALLPPPRASGSSALPQSLPGDSR